MSLNAACTQTIVRNNGSLTDSPKHHSSQFPKSYLGELHSSAGQLRPELEVNSQVLNIMKAIDSSIQRGLINSIGSYTTALESVRGFYVQIRDLVVGKARTPEAAKKLRESLYTIVKGQADASGKAINFDTAKSVLGILMREDGLRQRAEADEKNERMTTDRRDLVGKIQEFINALPECEKMSDVDKVNLMQAVGRQYKKASKAAK